MPRPRSLRSLVVTTNDKRNLTSGPPSPTFSDTTNVSAMNFGEHGPAKIITRANLKASQQAYEELINTGATYRAALLTMSKVTAAFADAMEKCSGLKGASYEAGTRLQAASGLHHLIGNHWYILAETLDRKFEKPLREHLQTYRSVVADRTTAYEKTLYEKSRLIRQTEMTSMNRKERNLQNFREALAILQRQVDELDDRKAQHYQEILEHEEEVWDVVQGKVCLVVRSTMDVFDKFTTKGSDPVIEPMLQTVPDPFDSYGPPPAEDQIFSILAPLSITASNSPSPSPVVGIPEAEAPDMSPWMASNSGGYFPGSASPPTWMDAQPSSSSPVSPESPSPMPSSNRQHSPPSTPKRNSGSRLRPELSVIDESRARGSEIPDRRPPQPPPEINVNGDSGTSWGFTYGTSPYGTTTPGDTTPRNSLLFLSTPSPGHEPDPDDDRRSLDSDKTTRIPIAA